MLRYLFSSLRGRTEWELGACRRSTGLKPGTRSTITCGPRFADCWPTQMPGKCRCALSPPWKTSGARKGIGRKRAPRLQMSSRIRAVRKKQTGGRAFSKRRGIPRGSRGTMPGRRRSLRKAGRSWNILEDQEGDSHRCRGAGADGPHARGRCRRTLPTMKKSLQLFRAAHLPYGIINALFNLSSIASMRRRFGSGSGHMRRNAWPWRASPGTAIRWRSAFTIWGGSPRCSKCLPARGHCWNQALLFSARLAVNMKSQLC